MWPEFENEADIPEAFKGAYEKAADGKWKVKASGPTTEDLDAVKEALRKEREIREAAEKKAATEEKARKALEQKHRADAAGLTDAQLKELRDAVRGDLTEEFSATIKAKEDEIARLASVAQENRTLKLDMAVKALMLSKSVGVRGDRADALFQLTQGEFDLTEDGKPKLVKHPGKTIEQFLATDLKAKFPEFYVGTQAGGGGAGGAHSADGSPIMGTDAQSILTNPTAALNAAREAGAR